ncbi:MAG TPA: NUDIX domain-containing protein [Myxococcota bacterium]|nr:NUDIX domain-containing protein [Myxococcota bacterium]HRY96191.1 NUDIX domain-containing protein [Myxococcota bacterium]HSA24232.1 NUDIX domain-containing protein [Myxococcota bacterium]
MKPKLCNQCGAALTRRVVEDRERDVCPACHTIFYQNPLPVASAVVVDEARRVLLVRRKREPRRGMWCLPMGFAELDETIEAAALRELREEAGITGRVLGLLDVDSYASDFYGDLLVVSFEIERVSGQACPGDDAEEATYQPLDQVPPLAFPSNTKALCAYAARHGESWAIQDSFQRMEAGSEGAALLSDALLRLLDVHVREIAAGWLAEVRSNPTTTSYRKLEEDEAVSRAVVALSQFGHWLSGAGALVEVRAFYQNLGQERRRQGFALHEVLSSLTLLRKQIWEFARGHGVWSRPLEAYRVLELDRRIVAFFDRAMVHTAMGFESP